MHTKEPKEDPLVDLGYESRDIDVKTIEKAVMWFFTFATVMFIVGAWIYANLNPSFSPKYQAQKEDLRIPKPPNPLLQDNVSNFTDIAHLRQHETVVLEGTGYTDATKTVVHIPIDRAIDILAKRGLPQTGASVPAVSKGNTTDEKKPSTQGAPTDARATKPGTDRLFGAYQGSGSGTEMPPASNPKN
jgi:hypothetical protein